MIAIRGMKEMPSCCLWDCPLAREDGGACQLADVRTSNKGRPKDCPLIEIVTCKDCKHGTKLNNYDYYLCDRFTSTHASFLGFSPDNYCASGERKENDSK